MTSSAGSSSSSNANDPSNFLTNPPSTLVKIVGTSRDDLNGKICVALSYNASRARYAVSILPGQGAPATRPGEAAARAAGNAAAAGSALSFKPKNLVKATAMERIKTQSTMALHQAKQFLNDPENKERFRRVYTSMDQPLPSQVKPEHALGILLVVWFIMAKLIGFSKAVLLTSLVMMLGVIVAPDLMAGITDPKAVAQNFPRRLRENIVQATGYTSLTERQATIGFGIFMLFAMKLLLTSSASSGAASAASTIASERSAAPPDVAGIPPVPPPLKQGSFGMEEIYKLGFDDAKAGKEFGASTASIPKDSVQAAGPRGKDGAGADTDWPYDPPPPAQTESKFGFTWVMAVFGLLRGVKEMAITPDRRFDAQFLATNFKMQPPLKLALLAFCSYRVFRAFF